MKEAGDQIAVELLACAEALSDAAQRRDLPVVTELLERREVLLLQLRDGGSALGPNAVACVEGIRGREREADEGLRVMLTEVAEELGRIRGARSSLAKQREPTKPSRFVSTRC